MKILISLPLLLFLPGYLLSRAFKGRKPPTGDLTARAWLQGVVASIVVSSWTGLILVECGCFSLRYLLIALAALSACIYLMARPRLRGGSPAQGRTRSLSYLALVLSVFVLLCLCSGVGCRPTVTPRPMGM